jgi:hypothetical protein
MGIEGLAILYRRVDFYSILAVLCRRGNFAIVSRMLSEISSQANVVKFRVVKTSLSLVLGFMTIESVRELRATCILDIDRQPFRTLRENMFEIVFPGQNCDEEAYYFFGIFIKRIEDRREGAAPHLTFDCTR